MTAVSSAPPTVDGAFQSPVRLRSFALAALAHTADDSTPEGQYLLAQRQAIDSDWLEALSDYLAQPHSADETLLSLADELQLTLLEMLVIALTAAVEEDVMVGRALAYLQSPLGGSRPTLALLASALSPVAPEYLHPIDVLVSGTAVRSGLLQLAGDNKPLPEQTVSLSAMIRLALNGYDAACCGLTIGLRDDETIPLSRTILAQARQYAIGLDAQQTLVIRTGMPQEGRSAASAIAAELNCRPVFISTVETAEIGAWLFLRRLLPVFCLQLAPGERHSLPTLPFYRGPLLVVCGPDGSVETASGAALSWHLPIPSPEERQHLWQHIVGGDIESADELAHHFRHSSGRIAQLGRMARQYSRIRGRERPTFDDVVQASRKGEGAGLEALAQLGGDVPDDALVIPTTLRAELENLLLRCRVRDGLADGLGISAATRYVPGVRALFVGASGTGKTLAAGWLATRLGLPLYRVDLASVTSKYIGETEKNLARLLALAELSEVVLLFDEADSMFAKRTDVKESNDRFANAQTNYLLQRIETYTGIVLLTSNSRARFDAAFTRRLDVLIEFPLPGPEERRLLWQSHLGANHMLTPTELNRLAATVDLGGGYIRSAVLTAAVFVSQSRRAITYEDVVNALAMEYQKLGRQIPADL